MPLNENDLSYLIDIVDCIADINEFTKPVEYIKGVNTGIINRT
jgi:hypothetical protein